MKNSLRLLIPLLLTMSIAHSASIPLKGQWILDKSFDEMNDKTTVYVANMNKPEKAAIGIFCSSKKHIPYPIYIMAYVGDGGSLDVGDEVSWRFDKQQPIGPIVLKETAMNYTAFVIPEAMYLKFLDQLKKSSQLLVRVRNSNFSEFNKDIHYDIRFARSALDALKCN